jgi:FkbM family methyltransferase
MMVEDDVWIKKSPITVKDEWEMAGWNIKVGNIIPDNIIDSIEQFSGKQPLTNQYGCGGGSIFKVSTFLENYDRVIGWFKDNHDKFQQQYSPLGFMDCYMVVYYMLCGNVAINGLTNVECEHAAVCDDSDNTIKIDLPDYHLPNNFGGLELMAPRISDNQYMTKTTTASVETVCLDNFDEHIDFLKMDIEGMEHVALAGAKKVIAKSRPICFVEMYKTDTDAVKKFFKKLDYVAYAVKPDDWIFFPKECKFCINNTPRIDL